MFSVQYLKRLAEAVAVAGIGALASALVNVPGDWKAASTAGLVAVYSVVAKFFGDSERPTVVK